MLDLLKDYAKVSSRTDVPHIASPEVRTSMCYPLPLGTTTLTKMDQFLENFQTVVVEVLKSATIGYA